MAFAKKCDRCGALYVPKGVKVDTKSDCDTIILVTSVGDDYWHDDEREVFDLCPECLTSLNGWFVNGKGLRE